MRGKIVKDSEGAFQNSLSLNVGCPETVTMSAKMASEDLMYDREELLGIGFFIRDLRLNAWVSVRKRCIYYLV